MLMRTAVQGVRALLLPGACLICARAHEPTSTGDIVCGVCRSRVVALAEPQCVRCGHPGLSVQLPMPAMAEAMPPSAVPVDHATQSLRRDNLPTCRWCPRLHPALRAVRSASRMDRGTGAALVHALKYEGWTAAAVAMARAMSRLDWPEDVREEQPLLVPMPLSTVRRRERGYNQAEVLARALRAALGRRWALVVSADVLQRTRHTQSQVRLTPSERAGNVSKAFAVPTAQRARLRGAHVLLVDDVITTAATVNAATEALLDGGARIVSCVTFGRAPDPGDRALPDPDPSRT